MGFEIGDRFVINWDLIKKSNPDVGICLYPDREFSVSNTSLFGSGIYYINDCVCGVCRSKIVSIKISRQLDDGSYLTVINKDKITLTQKKIQSERNNKLKDLGI
jgi:hypothetical protein